MNALPLNTKKSLLGSTYSRGCQGNHNDQINYINLVTLTLFQAGGGGKLKCFLSHSWISSLGSGCTVLFCKLSLPSPSEPERGFSAC